MEAIKKRQRKENRGLIKAAAKFMPFDYSFMLSMERECLSRMLRFFESDEPVAKGSEHAAKWIRISLRLLDLMNDNGFSEIKGSYPDYTVKQLKYVNVKNWKRFMPKTFRPDLDNDEQYPLKVTLREALYDEKVWHLYNKIRLYNMRYWYD